MSDKTYRNSIVKHPYYKSIGVRKIVNYLKNREDMLHILLRKQKLLGLQLELQTIESVLIWIEANVDIEDI